MQKSLKQTCELKFSIWTGSVSWTVTDLTPPSTTFLAISTPRPDMPLTSTFDAPMRFIASWPNTYLQWQCCFKHLYIKLKPYYNGGFLHGFILENLNKLTLNYLLLHIVYSYLNFFNNILRYKYSKQIKNSSVCY